ncbi:MAG TPA: hypothetical protein VLG28_07210, partial [Acidimicrobiia bacterium]|nr:hypothetical protein [Acidimicrobiia bacterium]
VTGTAIALAALIFSLGIHLFAGHRPGSAQALGFFEFFTIHPSYLVAAALPLGAGTLLWFCMPSDTSNSGDDWAA